MTKPIARPKRSWLLRIATGAGAVVLLLLASFVKDTTPSEAEWQAPIEVRGEMGETLTGRNIQATVHDVQVARTVRADDGWTGETTGIWVVAEVTAAAVVTDFGATLGTGTLRIGDLTFSASTRGDDSMESRGLSAGIPTRGSLIFEIPVELLESTDARVAEIRLASSRDARLDSMVVVAFDLTTVTPVDEIAIEAPVWGAE